MLSKGSPEFPVKPIKVKAENTLNIDILCDVCVNPIDSDDMWTYYYKNNWFYVCKECADKQKVTLSEEEKKDIKPIRPPNSPPKQMNISIQPRNPNATWDK